MRWRIFYNIHFIIIRIHFIFYIFIEPKKDDQKNFTNYYFEVLLEMTPADVGTPIPILFFCD